MIKNYFKIAWRNLLKTKGYSAINIIGLGTGMAVAIVIGLWIWDEVSFNKNFRNLDRLAQAMTTGTGGDGETYVGSTIAMPLANELRNKYANKFKAITTVGWENKLILGSGNRNISGHFRWVEKDFPSMFSLRIMKGNGNVLKDPSSMLISSSIAKALFGDADPINKTVRLVNEYDLRVGGVFEDFPRNSYFYKTNVLLPFTSTHNWMNRQDVQTNWNNHNGQLFVQLNDNVDIKDASAAIRNISTAHIKEYKEYHLFYPMSRLHLHGEFKNGEEKGGGIQFVWLFGIIGVFVLMLACINFMNLSTARSEKRAKEVGIRKAIGSMRKQLIGQFLSESLLVALLAFILSLILVQLSLPLFNKLSDKVMSLPWTNAWFWLIACTFTFFTGLISGSYPAFYLSSFRPVKVLKGTFKAGRLAGLPRKVLVVLQFTVSIALIIGTIIVYQQIQYAKNRPVGYTREGLITIDKNTTDLHKNAEIIRTELLKTGAAEDMSLSGFEPTEMNSGNIGFSLKGKAPNSLPWFGTLRVNYDFGHTIGWKVIKGRDFSRNFSIDTANAIILNDSAAKQLGVKDPIGQVITYNGNIFEDKKDYVIVGVVENMVQESPYQKPSPIIFFCGQGWMGTITVRLSRNMPVHTALASVEKVFKRYNPASPFEYKFVDESYAEKFSNEQRIGDLSTVFAILAVFISCLGLFGLASFVAEQRTKEIGVRKVLGATVFNLWRMLSKDFVLLVIISCLIAIPVGWYFLYQWLQDYEYRTPISWWIFAASASGALIITLLTVSFQAIKAALANPVRSLRTE